MATLNQQARDQDPPSDVTAIYCHTQYWRQLVSATIRQQTMEPLNVVPLGKKELLPWDAFNTTNFEATLNSGSLGFHRRGDILPISNIPRYLETVAGSNLTLGVDQQAMVGLALATTGRPLGDYLNWQTLSQAYVDAYRLLFARAMVDVLGTDFATSDSAIGQQQDVSEAVVLEAVFVHVVVGLLAVVSLATVALLVLSLIRERKIRTNPSTIASVMALVADNDVLLSDFAELDCCTEEDVRAIISKKRYKLVNDEAGTR